MKRIFSPCVKKPKSAFTLNAARLAVFLLFGQIAILTGCASFPPDYSTSAAWSAPAPETVKGSVRIISVSAERPGDWGSLEKEINTLVPLFFAEESYCVTPPDAAVLDNAADYTVSVQVREREYQSGWQTRRSLSCVVMIWPGDDGASTPGNAPSGRTPSSRTQLPLAAGRSLIQGTQSLASSKSLGALLKKAIKSAVRGLPEKEDKDADEAGSAETLLVSGEE